MTDGALNVRTNTERTWSKRIALCIYSVGCGGDGVGKAELTRLLLRRHLSHALLTRVGSLDGSMVFRLKLASEVAEDVISFLECVRARRD